ncbi:MAG TPA: hypothetical protein VLA40_05260, partial [Rheinheimera sp.]|nr:hypothetical protein [Rheinheimera sp.]
MNTFSHLITAVALLSACAVFAADKTVTNKLYTEKGEAGQQVITEQSDGSLSAELNVGWNNRVVKIKEKLSLNDKGLPVLFEAA